MFFFSIKISVGSSAFVLCVLYYFTRFMCLHYVVSKLPTRLTGHSREAGIVSFLTITPLSGTELLGTGGALAREVSLHHGARESKEESGDSTVTK